MNSWSRGSPYRRTSALTLCLKNESPSQTKIKHAFCTCLLGRTLDFLFFCHDISNEIQRLLLGHGVHVADLVLVAYSVKLVRNAHQFRSESRRDKLQQSTPRLVQLKSRMHITEPEDGVNIPELGSLQSELDGESRLPQQHDAWSPTLDRFRQTSKTELDHIAGSRR